MLLTVIVFFIHALAPLHTVNELSKSIQEFTSLMQLCVAVLFRTNVISVEAVVSSSFWGY